MAPISFKIASKSDIGGFIYFCFAKIVCMIVGEFDQRAVYKRSNVIGNDPDSALETSGAIYRAN